MAATKTANETVETTIARNVAYVAKAPTANLSAFRDWCLAQVEGSEVVKTKAAREAFILGNRGAGLRSKFQEDRRTGVIETSETFADYVIRSTGINVDAMSDAAKTALLAGIGTYTEYVKFRNSKNA